ncbi:MAG: phage tail sheath subtilisin-like domain-containing protein [Variovorax sp.]
MPEYLQPGVYVEELASGLRPVEGVPTSTAAFVGEAERGATMPRLVTSLQDFEHWFGGVDKPDRFLPHAVRGFFENGGKRLFIGRVVPAAATTAETDLGAGFTLRAIGPGSWGTRIYAMIDDGSATQVGPDGAARPVGFRLRVAWYATPPLGDPRDWFDGKPRAMRPSRFEEFDDLVTDAQAPGFFETQLSAHSALVECVRGPEAASGARPPNGFVRLDRGGVDGASPPSVEDYVGGGSGAEGDEARGLSSLELPTCREIALVYAPGASHAVGRAVVAHCERQSHRFAVVDPEREAEGATFDARDAVADSKYAALYWPWLVVAHPRTGVPISVPPGGHVLGVYARTDVERGVFKAPANEVLRGVLAPALAIDEGLQAVLSQRGINTIRQFPGRGLRVWGARTLSSDSQWKYVPVRRLFIYLERSIDEGLQWTVFEPNGERLWSRVADSVRLFLRGCWRDGALLGATEREAFFVRCDRTTMTQDDILNGRLVCEVGVAPVRPAEFVVFRIFARCASSTGQQSPSRR